MNFVLVHPLALAAAIYLLGALALLLREADRAGH